ncbi:MAG: hypothetical protein IT375_12310 [Polyangiaceae bacterium]|nr:hypothetical protein [Polyangiaceae bacterium]
MRAWLLALACVGCTGWVGGPRPAALEARPTPGRVEGERFLLADGRRARDAGASEQRVVAADAGAPGDRISGFVSVPAEACALVMARGSREIDDVDLFAFGDDGTLLGADERPNKAPTLLLCPPHPERIYVSARIASGFGIVALGVQSVAATDGPKLGALLDVPGFATRADAGAVAEIERALGAHRRGIGGRWQELRRAALPVEPGTPSLISAVIEPGRCLDAWVTPTEAVSHLDVALLDADGRTAGRAVSHGRSRFLVACAADKTAVTLEVRPQSGRGVAVVVLSQSKDGGRAELGGRIPIVELGASRSLDEVKTDLAARLDKGDYDTPRSALRVELPIAERTSTDLDLAAGCTRIDVLGGRPLAGVEAWLWAGEALSAHDRAASHATLFACGAAGKRRLDLEALARPGPVEVLARKLRQVPPLFTQHPLAAGRLLARVLARGTAPRFDQLGAPKVVTLGETRRVDSDLLVPIQRCADVVLALGPGAAGAEVRIVDKATGKEIERGFGGQHAAARACAVDRRASLDARVELSVSSGQTDGLVLTRLLAPTE